MERDMLIYSVDEMNIEYSVVGKGEPILIFHGGHSNAKEEFGYQALVQAGYQLITPSRPGYGVTSSKIGEDFSTACTFYRKLLDHLNIQKVHVIGISAGGPTAIYFASHQPNRVQSLTLQSSVTRQWLTRKDLEYKAAKVIFRPSVEKYTWLMLRYFNKLFPGFIFKRMFPQFSNLPYHEAKDKIRPTDIVEVQKMNQRQRSGSGFFIDLVQVNTLREEDIKAVKAPTFIMHSRHDGSVPIDHALYAHEQIENSQLKLLDSWGHLIWLGDTEAEVNQLLQQFLKNHAL